MDKRKNHIEDEYTDPFAEYLRAGEPDRADKVYAWQTAIGLQDVDQLRPSEYLLNTARDHIEGDISIEEARHRIESYYEEHRQHEPKRTEVADFDKKQLIKRPIKQPIEENSLLQIIETKSVSSRTKANMIKLQDEFGKEKIFGRGDVMEVLGITQRPATTLIGKMYELTLTERITGAGKGKYRFLV